MPRTRSELTEPEAWHVIAEHFATRRWWPTTGLCLAVQQLYCERLDGAEGYYVSSETRHTMHRRIKRYIEAQKALGIWFWNWAYDDRLEYVESLRASLRAVKRHREGRAMAALWMALEAKTGDFAIFKEMP